MENPRFLRIFVVLRGSSRILPMVEWKKDFRYGGVKMEIKKKAFSKREKIAGIVASTAIAAVPFLVTPVQHGYAESSGSPSSSPTTTPTPIHKIYTIFLPEHGAKNIDLSSLYDGTDFQVTSTNPNVADWNKAFLQKGLLRINANSVNGTTAKATFTVTLDKTEDSQTKQYIDTFDVIDK